MPDDGRRYYPCCNASTCTEKEKAMITPGKDDNYPGGSISGKTGDMWWFMPHTIVGVFLVFIVLFIAWHLFKGTPRRRR
jgi:hypothetical protein